jgi:GNAT superfamily N-acetyltransferase
VVTIRIAGADDVAAIADLRERWTIENRGESRRGDATFASRFAAWFAAEQRQRTFWLAEDGGAAIGMVNLITFERMPAPGADAGRWGYLGNMYVVPERRNGGAGARLVSALLDHARVTGLERVVLSPSARSVPFWRRAGFGDADELLVWRPG